ncbi:MAG: MATE family efflux transporter [Bacteroidales bacterium]
MDKIKDLTTGSIPRVIGTLAAPLIGASFVQMAFSMTDMIWLGRLGSGPVAAVGAAFFFTWMNNALSYTPKVGAEITVSQSLGSGDKEMARRYADHAVTLSTVMGILFGIFVLIFAPQLMSIFHLEPDIADLGVDYLRWVVPGMMATFNNNTYASVYYGAGNSKTPFRFIGMGLVLNIVLDPLLIFGYGPIPAMGTHGAALATMWAQLFVFGLFVSRLYTFRSPIGKLKLFTRMRKEYLRRIFRLGLPVSFQSALFSMIGMTLASFASRFGHIGVAAQSLGAQIEAISWMTASGFSTALSSFVGQNYGAKAFARIRKAYQITLVIAGAIGLLAGVCFVAFPELIFGIFIKEPDALAEGARYLRIMGYSQLLMVTELVTTGGFNGVGKTQIPAFTGIVFNLMRIPMALLLMSTALELSGIWWSITISSCLKGAVLAIWFYFGVLRKFPKTDVTLR